MTAPRPASTLQACALGLRAGGLSRGRVLIDSLDLRVAAGERWVVIGPNGAGKSSLLAALAGIFALASGEVRLDGRPLAAWPLAGLAAERAWCPQFWSDPFASTVAETAMLAHRRQEPWAPRVSNGRDPVVDGVLARLDLQSLVDADVQTLSGGERQRVAIATALLQDAPLLLLDEPVAHLDPAHQRLLLAVLAEHARAGGAVVASLHDLNLAWDLASHAVVLDGHGGARAGRRDDILQAPLLSSVFGVDIVAIDVGGVQRFVVGGDVDAALVASTHG